MSFVIFGKIMYDFCFIAVNDLETDARTLNLTRMLSKHGCKICIIALGNTDNNDSKSDNIDIFHINPSKAKRASVRILDFYSTLRKKYSNIESKYYIAEDLYSLPYASKLAKKFLGKLIYDSREIYSALGPLNGKSLKQYLLTKLEARYIKNVDGIIVSGELDAEHLKSIYNQDTPISVIKNLPSYKDRFESKILRNKFGIPVTSSILLYQGMILPGRGLKPIIAALPVIDKAVICILGEGGYESVIKEYAREKKVEDRMIFCGKVSYDLLHEYTCSADVGLAFIEPVTLSYNLALPNKLFEYCMARIPTLATDLPAMMDVIETHKIGLAIAANSSNEKIAQSIKYLIDNKNDYIKSCDMAARELSYESQENDIISFFNL